MKYVIAQSEKRTTQAGKPFLKAALQDESGQILDNVSIWSDYPNFSELNPGAEVEGSVEVNARGYKNLKTGNGQPQGGQAARGRTDLARAAFEDRRSEAIRLAQDRKNESIAYFNATNAAISLVSSMPSKLMSTFNRTILKQEIDYWRTWFLEEWKKHEIALPRFRSES